jgi:hypothetical protein
VFYAMDEDGDGTVDESELLDFAMEYKHNPKWPHPEKRIKHLMEKIDTNQDGTALQYGAVVYTVLARYCNIVCCGIAVLQLQYCSCSWLARTKTVHGIDTKKLYAVFCVSVCADFYYCYYKCCLLVLLPLSLTLTHSHSLTHSLTAGKIDEREFVVFFARFTNNLSDGEFNKGVDYYLSTGKALFHKQAKEFQGK